MEATLEQLATRFTKAIFGALLTEFIARQFTRAQFLGTLQLLLMVATLVAVVVLTWIKVRPRAGRIVSTVAAVCLNLVLLLCFSLVSQKRIAIEQTLPALPDEAARLAAAGQLPVHRSTFNQVTLVGRPVVAQEAQGIHVVLEVEWNRTEGPDRAYRATVHLEARMRVTPSGTQRDPFTLVDYSVAPRKGWPAYLLGWFEAPFLMSQSDDIVQWVGNHVLAGT